MGTMLIWTALLLIGIVDIAALFAIVSPVRSIRFTYPPESPFRRSLERQITNGSKFWEWRLGSLLVVLISLRMLVPIIRSLLNHHT